MVIREAQMSILDQRVKIEFIKRLAEYIRTHHASTIVRLSDRELPVSAIPSNELEALVHSGIERASAYCISWQSALASFVVTMFVVVPNFDEDTQVRRLLTDSDIEPDYRMDSVGEQIAEEHWNALRESYDSEAWKAGRNG